MWDAQSLGTAVTVLVTLLVPMILLLARTYVQVEDMLRHGRDSHTLKVSPESGISVSGTGQGGGGITISPSTPTSGVSLPQWSQRVDVGIVSTDTMGSTSCGLECVAYVIYAVKGVMVPASYERFLLGKVDQPGYTRAEDLVKVLAMNHINAHAVGTTWPNIKPECIRALGLRKVPILLGYWLTPNQLHWVAGERGTDQGLWVVDPWFGKERLITWAEVQHLYASSYVHVDDQAQYTM